VTAELCCERHSFELISAVNNRAEMLTSYFSTNKTHEKHLSYKNTIPVVQEGFLEDHLIAHWSYTWKMGWLVNKAEK